LPFFLFKIYQTLIFTHKAKIGETRAKLMYESR